MDSEIWKIAGWAGGAVAIIIALTKMLEKVGFKKNGVLSNGTLQQGMKALNQLTENGTKSVNLLENIGDTLTRIENVNMKNGEKLDALTSNIGIAMERQTNTMKKLDDLRT